MSDDISSIIDIRTDPEREQRKGVPEVILGETKEPGQIVAMVRSLLADSGMAIISRVKPGIVEVLREAFQGYTFRIRENSQAVVISRPDYVRRSTGGLVGVISAGTSDIPVAEEAALIAEEMGCEVTCIYDVGVAGLHRSLCACGRVFPRDGGGSTVAGGKGRRWPWGGGGGGAWCFF